MSHVSERLQLLAGTAITALAFGAVAPAVADGGVAHPLLQPQIGGKYNMYRTDISIALRKATGDDMSGLRAGGFVVAFEDKLRAGPTARPQMVTYPQEFTPNMLVVAAVVPPANLFATASVPFCADQNMAIVYDDPQGSR